MADKDVWEKVLGQLTNPLDWVAAGLGAIAGGAVSVALHFTDLGASAGGGAIAGVTLSKSIARALAPSLKRRAKAIEVWLSRNPPPKNRPRRWEDGFRRDLELWRKGIITDEQFVKTLDDVAGKLRAADDPDDEDVFGSPSKG
jgi:hypothetical protein